MTPSSLVDIYQCSEYLTTVSFISTALSIFLMCHVGVVGNMVYLTGDTSPTARGLRWLWFIVDASTSLGGEGTVV
jgi:hypothetical protein